MKQTLNSRRNSQSRCVLAISCIFGFMFVVATACSGNPSTPLPTDVAPAPVKATNPATPNLELTETTIAGNIFATQTANAPTTTSIPSSTLTPSLTPTPTCAAISFLEQTQSALEHFSDLVNLATATSRIALTPVVGQMQDARRTYKSLDAPECAKDLQQTIVGVMDLSIDAFLSFMAQEGDAAVSAKLAAVNAQLKQGQIEIRRVQLRMGTPVSLELPTDTPVPPTVTRTPLPTPARIGQRVSMGKVGLKVEQVDFVKSINHFGEVKTPKGIYVVLVFGIDASDLSTLKEFAGELGLASSMIDGNGQTYRWATGLGLTVDRIYITEMNRPNLFDYIIPNPLPYAPGMVVYDELLFDVPDSSLPLYFWQDKYPNKKIRIR